MVVSTQHSEHPKPHICVRTSSNYSSFSDASFENDEPHISIERELTRKITWAPSSILHTLSGFDPEDGLENSWSPDLSSTGGSVAASVDSHGASTASSVESTDCRDGETKGQAIQNSPNVDLERKLSLTLSTVPPKILESTASDADDKKSESKESRESCVIVESADAIEVREELIDDTSTPQENSSMEYRSPADILRGDGEIDEDITSTCSSSSLRDITSMCSSSSLRTVRPSVEVSLVPRKKVSRMQRFKVKLSKMISGVRKHLGRKSTKANSSIDSHTDDKECDAETLQSTPSSPSPFQSTEPELQPLITLPTEKYSAIDHKDTEVTDTVESNNLEKYPDVLSAVSTVTTSNATYKTNVATTRTLKQAETFLDKTDSLLQSIGLGCLVP